MASSKTYTWKEFMIGMHKMPADLHVRGLDEMRDQFYNISRILETVADAASYETVPGTKPGSNRTKGRNYGMRLHQTIRRFKNKDNKFKAYVVLGNLTTQKGGAIYGAMQLGGYRPGKHQAFLKQKALEMFPSKRRRAKVATRAGRAWLLMQKNRIAGKDYFRKADQRYGTETQNMSFKVANHILGKYMDRI